MKIMNSTKNENERHAYYCFAFFILIVFVILFNAEVFKQQKGEIIAQKKSPAISIVKEALVNVADPLLMSVDELRSYAGFENMDEASARSYIYSMQQFCIITFELYKDEKQA